MARGLLINPVELGGGATAMVPAAPLPTLIAPAPALSSAIALDWRALFGASAIRRALEVWPSARLTSFLRSPARNRAVGGRSNSFHLVGLAADFVLPASDRAAFVSWARREWPAAHVVDEGDHIHVEWNRVAELPLATILLVAGAVAIVLVVFTRSR